MVNDINKFNLYAGMLKNLEITFEELPKRELAHFCLNLRTYQNLMQKIYKEAIQVEYILWLSGRTGTGKSFTTHLLKQSLKFSKDDYDKQVKRRKYFITGKDSHESQFNTSFKKLVKHQDKIHLLHFIVIESCVPSTVKNGAKNRRKNIIPNLYVDFFYDGPYWPSGEEGKNAGKYVCKNVIKIYKEFLINKGFENVAASIQYSDIQE